jgi:DNA-binding CsgD family transcriptional regulator
MARLHPYFDPGYDTIRERLWRCRRDRDFLLKVLGNFPHGTINVLDRDFRRLLSTGKGFEEVGLKPETLVGKTLQASMLPGSPLGEALPHYEDAFHGQCVEFEYCYREKLYLVSASPLDHHEHETTTILVVAQNITNYKSASKEGLRALDIPQMIGSPANVSPSQPYGLTEREREILRLMTKGMANKQIAIVLGRSLNTINKQVSHILTKLGAASRTEASVRAIQERLIQIAGFG